MAGAQNKRNSPGAFRSCLIPYKNQIFTCGSMIARAPEKYKCCWRNSSALKFAGQPSPASSKSAPGNPIPMKDHRT